MARPQCCGALGRDGEGDEGGLGGTQQNELLDNNASERRTTTTRLGAAAWDSNRTSKRKRPQSPLGSPPAHHCERHGLSGATAAASTLICTRSLICASEVEVRLCERECNLEGGLAGRKKKKGF